MNTYRLLVLALLFSMAASTIPTMSFANEGNVITKTLPLQKSAGGGMTVRRLSTRTYIYPGRAASSKQKLDFWSGFSFFRDPWVTAPSATKARDGLGPLFNARSCIACHQDGSRSAMPEIGESMPTALIIRIGFSKPNLNHDNNTYGGQIQPRSTKYLHGKLDQAPKGETWLDLSYSTIDGKYHDGESYQLQKPHYRLTQLAYGQLPEHALVSPRYAPNIYGTGLLDAITQNDLVAQEDSKDTNKDGISAKYNRVLNVKNGKIEIGRFGMKAKHPTLNQQVAAAFRDDIGITNSFFPKESCTDTQIYCQKASALGGHDTVEIEDKNLDLVFAFNRLLGVPPARNINKPKQQQGQQLFHQLSCAQCHTPSYVTDENYPDLALANQKIWPYTDLALHDMGEGLADGVFEAKATGNEWRTPPLWGIGLQKIITGQSRFLHDGRARSIEEAILWHGGEATKAQTEFKQLTKEQRQALLMFLKSI
jgi:CxxC motif-containing protein (DUF1111 family)